MTRQCGSDYHASTFFEILLDIRSLTCYIVYVSYY